MILAVTYFNLGEVTSGVICETKAFQLRQRASKREQYSISANYYRNVTGELEKAVQQYLLWAHDYPREAVAYGQLGSAYEALGEHEKALVNARKALELAPNIAMAYENVAFSYLALNRPDEAAATLAEAQKRNLEDPSLHLALYELASFNKSASLMKQQAEWLAHNAEAAPQSLPMLADSEAFRGKLLVARGLYRSAAELARSRSSPDRAAQASIQAALWDAAFGNSQQATAAVSSALSTTQARGFLSRGALVLAWAGESRRCELLLQRLQKEFPLDTLVQHYWKPTIRAKIQLHQGDAEGALKTLRDTTQYEFSYSGVLYPVYVRGESYLMAGKGKEATAEFQKILDHRGVAVDSPTVALAPLGLARAHTLEGDKAAARTAYQDFLALWKDADPEIPILKQAKAEYARLQ
jgi:eukaryotic-like serine/threonine-protein kinase